MRRRSVPIPVVTRATLNLNQHPYEVWGKSGDVTHHFSNPLLAAKHVAQNADACSRVVSVDGEMTIKQCQELAGQQTRIFTHKDLIL